MTECRAASRTSRGTCVDHGRLDTPLGHRREQRLLVELLVLLAVPVRPTHRRDEGDDRAAGPVGLGQAAGDVRGAGTVGAVDEGRSTAKARIPVGHVDGGGFAAGQDLTYADLFERDPEAVVTARHQEEVLGPERLQLQRDGGGRLRGDGHIAEHRWWS